MVGQGPPGHRVHVEAVPGRELLRHLVRLSGHLGRGPGQVLAVDEDTITDQWPRAGYDGPDSTLGVGASVKAPEGGNGLG